MKAKILNEAKEMKFEEVVQLAVNIEMVPENVKLMTSKGEVLSIRRGRFEGRLGRRPRSTSPSGSYQQNKKKRAVRENQRCYACRKMGHYAQKNHRITELSTRRKGRSLTERNISPKNVKITIL
jgi:hypothetical protein